MIYEIAPKKKKRKEGRKKQEKRKEGKEKEEKVILYKLAPEKIKGPYEPTTVFLLQGS